MRIGGLEVLAGLRDRPHVRAPLLEDLADIQRRLGEIGQAEELARAALLLREELHPPGAPEIQHARERLALALMEQGRHAQALELLEAARAGLLAHYGPGHAELVSVSAHLASLLTQRLEFERAESLLADVLGAGGASASDARGEWQLSLLQARLQSRRAEEMARACEELLSGPAASWRPFQLAQLELVHGQALAASGEHAAARAAPTDPLALSVESFLARAEQALGEHEAATARYARCLELWTEADDGDVHVRVDLAKSLTASLSHLSRHAEVVAVLEPLLPLVDASTARRPELAVACRLELGSSAQQVGDLAATLRFLEPGYGWLARVDAHASNSLKYLHLLAWALDRNGRSAEAVAPLEELVTRRRAALGIEHRETLGAENGLAHILGKSGRVAEAEARYRELLPRAVESLGAESDEVAWYRLRFAQLLVSEERATEALALVDEVLAALPPNAPTAAQLAALRRELRGQEIQRR